MCAHGEAERCQVLPALQGGQFVGEMCVGSFMHSMDRYLVNTNHVPGFVQSLKEARVHGTQPICSLSDHPMRPTDMHMVIAIQCNQCYNDGATYSCTPPSIHWVTSTPLASSPFVQVLHSVQGRQWGLPRGNKADLPVGACRRVSRVCRDWRGLLGVCVCVERIVKASRNRAARKGTEANTNAIAVRASGAWGELR